MKINIIEKPRIIMESSDRLHNYFGWPTAARLKNGKIAVGASGFRLGHVCPFGKAVISISSDEGKTYTAPVAAIDTPLDDRDAGLCPFGESGLIVTSFNNTREAQRLWLSESEKCDEAKALIAERIDSIADEDEEKYLGATFRISHDNGQTFGEIYKSPITSPHGPIELHDGSILWVGTRFTTTTEHQPIEAYRVNLDGSMQKLGEIESITENGEGKMSCEPYAVELKDGTIICHIRVEYKFTTYQSISKDGGKTWSKPIKLLADFGGAPCHILEHSSGALISTYGYRSEPFSIKAMFSLDGGESWDTDNVIATKDSFDWDLGYPSSVELPDGSLLTVFYGNFEKGGPAKIMQTIWNFK
ncbi:MAG: exo-alpha-sialidase [Oscillospiraceae bacterium]|nr:exo-alpha-sialidase [Oscillospiraceae bacterium]